MLPAGSYTFPLASHRIRNDCGDRSSPVDYRLSPGCIEYTATNGDTIQYTMAKTQQGWRIVSIGTNSSQGGFTGGGS